MADSPFDDLDDYLALRRYAVPDARIAVIGGGFIGSEIAASLAGKGCKVTMLFPDDAIGARVGVDDIVHVEQCEADGTHTAFS